MTTGQAVLFAVVDGITVLLSVLGSAFVVGVRVGRIEQSLKSMSERMARIEGMFTLRLKDGGE